MKKALKKILALALALTMVFALASCGGDPKPSASTGSSSPSPSAGNSSDPGNNPGEATRNWTGFHGWLDEDFESKDVSYQFTGYWDMGDPEYGIAFSFLMNLYSDGSARINQYGNNMDYRYFGSWEKVEDPDGDELNIKIVEETNESGELIDHKYSYTVYEESDGGFSFGYDFGIAAGQYFRVANLTGSKEVKYTTDSFKTAADAGEFVVAMEQEPSDNSGEDGESAGYTAPVAMGDQQFDATLVLNDETNAAFTAAVTFDCTYEKFGSTVVLSLPGEPEGFQAQIWPAVPHIWVVNNEDMTMKGATAAYHADSLLLVTFEDGAMRVEFPQYSMARDGFTYELSEDGATLTVTSTPDAETMGGFQQIWDGAGGTSWTIDGSTAAKAE